MPVPQHWQMKLAYLLCLSQPLECSVPSALGITLRTLLVIQNTFSYYSTLSIRQLSGLAKSPNF